MNARDRNIDLATIIENELVETHFQPLVSIKKKSIVGFEALIRGKNPDHPALIPPDIIFQEAAREGLTVQLDRLCRKKAIENFSPLYRRDEKFILSINIDPAILTEDTVGSNHLLDLAASMGIHPGRILIEIIESEIASVESLARFINTYRAKGFLLALDDIGTGFSNLDRIALVKPDILKIDKSLIRSIHREHHGREIIRSIVTLAHRIGSLVIAEGIETEEEVHSLLDLDIDFLQGFYFGAPCADMIPRLGNTGGAITGIAKKYKESTVKKITRKKLLHQEYSAVIKDFIDELSRRGPEEFDATLETLVQANPHLECAYIIDEYGTQMTGTVFYHDRILHAPSFLFQPGMVGTDQSSKDYFFLVSGGLPKYTTEPYISLATGNICITISIPYMDVGNDKYILCLDIVEETE